MRHIALAAGAAAIVFALSAVPSANASCGLLQALCPPPPSPYASAPDPGGDVDAGLPVPPGGGKLFGFNTNLWWQTSSGWNPVPFEVSRSAQAGAQLIRTTVSWSTFATSAETPLGADGRDYPVRGTVPHASSLRQLDELYDTATAAGLRLDLIVNDAPLWTSAYARCKPTLGIYPSGCGPVAQGKRLYPTAAHLQDLTNFVAALGDRYPGVMFEAWNEPNLDSGPQAAGGAFLGQMQCAVWQAAKALPQPALVLSAAFGDFKGEAATRQYLRDFYSTGDACFDRLSVHTYNGTATSFGAGSPLAGHMKIYRDARAEAGDTRPIWVTEFGFTTSGTKRFSEAEQATLTWREYNKLLSMPDVGAAIVHTLRDAPLPHERSPRNSAYGFGWLHRDGSPKPVFTQFSARAATA